MGEKQPEHVRVINDRAVLVNEGVPSKKKVSGRSKVKAPPPPRPVVDGDPTLGGYEELDNRTHIADLTDYGMDVSFVSDDDGGGLVFNAGSYPIAGSNRVSVLDTLEEDRIEEYVSSLARDAGLGGVEIFGNARQWIKVYDNEGHPLGQEGYVSDDVVERLVEFQRLLEDGGTDST